MTNDSTIRSLLSDKVNMTPHGFVADELNPTQFGECYELFFDGIFEISSSDITNIEGFGPFTEGGRPEYETCREFLIGTFVESKEGYWYRWKEMFETTMLDRSFFEKYFEEMESRIHFCEDRRYLVYNNTFFVNMVTDGKTTIGFPDWSRSGISDFLLDFAIMDLNKPYLKIPELLVQYCENKKISIPDFKDRFLCMAYYKGLDVLRWHASIDDEESCLSIMKSMDELKDRINAL